MRGLGADASCGGQGCGAKLGEAGCPSGGRRRPVRTAVCSASYLEDEAVGLVLGVHGGQPVLVLCGDVHLVARQCVAHLPELLDLGLEDLLQPLVLQLRALHLLLQL